MAWGLFWGRSVVYLRKGRTKFEKEKGMAEIVPGAEDDILGVVSKWKGEGREVALATVVTTWGSSPRPVGSQLAVDNQGNFVGSVSAGCVESAVVESATSIINDGKPKLLDFGIADDQAWEVGLSCGGKIEIFVEKVE
jgi:xanthine/CO dehydrogenase XdhC/CoxF family maturation factor